MQSGSMPPFASHGPIRGWASRGWAWIDARGQDAPTPADSQAGSKRFWTSCPFVPFVIVVLRSSDVLIDVLGQHVERDVAAAHDGVVERLDVES